MGGAETAANVVAIDGEGYDINVQMTTLVSALGQPEYLYQLEYAASEREHMRAERSRIYALGSRPPTLTEDE